MKRLELRVDVGGELAGRVFEVKSGGVRLGRSSTNDIHVPDEGLSRNHCLFEPDGDFGVKVTDLASANGTYVNGDSIGGETVTLKSGDRIEMGEVVITVIGGEPEKAPSVGGIDLGLGGDSSKPAEGKETKPRSPIANLLWVLVVIALGAAIYTVLQNEGGSGTGSGASTQIAAVEDKSTVVEMSYEKVTANSDSIFRYFMSLAPDGVLKVQIDDVPGEDRHVVKSKPLDQRARARLDEILNDPDLQTLDREYSGGEGEPPRLESCAIRVVYSSRSRSVRVVNTVEPDAFRRVRERLEAFSKNELGIWAIQYSRDRLVEMAISSAETARTKYQDREVESGNLHASIKAWQEAMFYLETVNPKPADAARWKTEMEAAEKELDARYRDQRFKADRAINIQDWETAKAELQTLCELVPDRDDDRYREASAKLIDVEKRMKK